MKHLTIIVPAGQNNLSSIVGPYKIFTRANAYWRETGRKELFNIELAGDSKNVDFYDGLFSVKPHTNTLAIKKTNLIIIPSLNHNYQVAIEGNQPLISWLTKQYKEGAEIATTVPGHLCWHRQGCWMEKVVPPIGLLRTISGICFRR